MIAATVTAVYLSGWLLTARVLFRAWRPSRVPLCTENDHLTPVDDFSYSHGTRHSHRCFRRRRPDGSRGAMDSDREAASGAMVLAFLFWPVIAFAAYVRNDAPGLPEEKEARHRAVLADIERQQAEVDAGRTAL